MADRHEHWIETSQTGLSRAVTKATKTIPTNATGIRITIEPHGPDWKILVIYDSDDD